MKQEEQAYTLDDLLNKACTYIKSNDEIDLIKRAYLFASKAHSGQLRLTGDEYILHPLNVAMILTEIYADSQTLATALLHDVINFTDTKIEDIEKIFQERGKSYPNYYSYHIKEQDYTYDITSYRKELKYKNNKPCKIVYAKTLKEDLKRRDFTINTLAIDKNGKLIDLMHAKKDLDRKIIRVVGDTETRLKEDKTRIIRAIRFACTLDFTLSNDIEEFLSKNGKYLNQIPKEYIKKELDKIFNNGNYIKFFEIVKKYKLNRYLNIEFKDIKNVYNYYGIWAQLNTKLPLTRKEMYNIKYINKLVSNGTITIADVRIYNEDIVKNASSILNIDSKVKKILEITKLHSIIDINFDVYEISTIVGISKTKTMFKKIEKAIMSGSLINDHDEIERFIINNRYE